MTVAFYFKWTSTNPHDARSFQRTWDQYKPKINASKDDNNEKKLDVNTIFRMYSKSIKASVDQEQWGMNEFTGSP